MISALEATIAKESPSAGARDARKLGKRNLAVPVRVGLLVPGQFGVGFRTRESGAHVWLMRIGTDRCRGRRWRALPER